MDGYGFCKAIGRTRRYSDASLWPKLRVHKGLPRHVAQEHVSRVAGPAERLTGAEWEVLRLITEGHTNRAIAHRLSYPAAVKDHVQKVIRKLGVSDRIQATVKEVRLGLLYMLGPWS